MKNNQIILKPGKEKAIRNRHHWIFSGAVDHLPTFADGQFLQVYSSKNEFLGWGYFNTKSKIIGRMVSFDSTPPMEAIAQNVKASFALRAQFFNDKETNTYRLINGEGDNLPGIVLDRYGDLLVMQLSTLGMEQHKTELIDLFVKHLKPRGIYEKSQLPSRKDEGLEPYQGTVYAQDGISFDIPVEVRENNLHFLVSIVEGQKTGFFIDHREMRTLVKNLSYDKRVLNCFAYTGAFSVYALAGGAKRVDSVDISEAAIAMAKRNGELNGYASERQGFYTADVFQFLREQTLDYDLIILDPPAFAKRQKDLVAACRGYKDINRTAMQKMPRQSLLLTSSCSYHVDANLFQTVVFQAAIEARRKVRILGTHCMAKDHPINICHPESDYLKSLLLYIE